MLGSDQAIVVVVFAGATVSGLYTAVVVFPVYSCSCVSCIQLLCFFQSEVSEARSGGGRHSAVSHPLLLRHGVLLPRGHPREQLGLQQVGGV